MPAIAATAYPLPSTATSRATATTTRSWVVGSSGRRLMTQAHRMRTA